MKDLGRQISLQNTFTTDLSIFFSQTQSIYFLTFQPENTFIIIDYNVFANNG